MSAAVGRLSGRHAAGPPVCALFRMGKTFDEEAYQFAIEVSYIHYSMGTAVPCNKAFGYKRSSAD